MTIIDRLNEVLEAERAGVETLSRLFPEAPSPETQKLFEGVRNDEAWACAGLVRSIKTLGGVASEKKGDFAEKVMNEPTLAARLVVATPTFRVVDHVGPRQNRVAKSLLSFPIHLQ